MEIHILLGVLLSIMVFSLGYAVVGTFRNSKNIQGNFHWLETVDRELHLRLDEINRRIDMDLDDLSRKIQGNVTRNEIDSRLDKLQNRMKSNFSDEDISKLKQEVDELVKAYHNQ